MVDSMWTAFRLDKQARHESDQQDGDQVLDDIREEFLPNETAIAVAPEQARTDDRHHETEPVHRDEASGHTEGETVVHAFGDDEDDREGSEKRK